jgi:hypothetical protein
MSSPEQALDTQLKNIQTRTGKTLGELYAHIRASGTTRHGAIRDFLKSNPGMGHGDANTLAHMYLKSLEALAPAPAAGESAGDGVLDALYVGPKAALRPIHERFMEAIEKFGPFEVAPKKANVSLRRKKQFAMIGPATNTRVEVGLNMKGVEPTERLLALPPGGMCPFKVKLTDASEVDEELIAWVRRAYEGAG